MQDGPNQFAADGGAGNDPAETVLRRDEMTMDEGPIKGTLGGPATDAEARERRRHRRARVLWGGVLIAQDFAGEVACTVSDISAGGAKLLVPAWPEGTDADVLDNLDVGHRVLLSLRASGEVPGEVVWQKPGRLGVRFELDPDEVRSRFEGVVPKD